MINTLKEFKPKIIIETHSNILYKQCNKFLYSLNYELFASLNNQKTKNNNEISENYYWVK